MLLYLLFSKKCVVYHIMEREREREKEKHLDKDDDNEENVYEINSDFPFTKMSLENPEPISYGH